MEGVIASDAIQKDMPRVSRRRITDTERAVLREKVTRALLDRPRGEGLPLGTAAKLLKQADRAGMTLEEWIALFNLCAS